MKFGVDKKFLSYVKKLREHHDKQKDIVVRTYVSY